MPVERRLPHTPLAVQWSLSFLMPTNGRSNLEREQIVESKLGSDSPIGNEVHLLMFFVFGLLVSSCLGGCGSRHTGIVPASEAPPSTPGTASEATAELPFAPGFDPDKHLFLPDDAIPFKRKTLPDDNRPVRLTSTTSGIGLETHGLRLDNFGPDGDFLWERPSGRHSSQIPLADLKYEERLELRPNSEVVMVNDERHLENFSAPGEYVISASDGVKSIKKWRIVRVNPEHTTSTSITGFVSTANYPCEVDEVSPMKVSCNMYVADVPYQNKNWTVLTVADFSLGATPLRGWRLRHWEPRKAALKDSIIDIKWQLWTIITSGEENALLVWKLRENAMQTVIPWCREPIELKSIRAANYLPDLRVVVSGIPGQHMFTTTSLDDALPKP